MRQKDKLPRIKKEIKDFLLSEEGKISKKDIAKIGISLAVLSILFTPKKSFAQHCDHSSSSHSSGPAGHNSAAIPDDPNTAGGRGGHNSFQPHGSHSSHHSHFSCKMVVVEKVRK